MKTSEKLLQRRIKLMASLPVGLPALGMADRY